MPFTKAALIKLYLPAVITVCPIVIMFAILTRVGINSPFTGVITALFSVYITELIIYYRYRYTYEKRRINTFKILYSDLLHHKDHLTTLQKTLGVASIYSSVSPILIYNCLSSDVIEVNKDQNLIQQLHNYLLSLELINRAMSVNDLRTACWINLQMEAKRRTEEDLKKYIIEILIPDIDSCIVILCNQYKIKKITE